ANAYGHGATPIAAAALAAGASRLGVATVGEGARLRHDGIVAPILILGPIDRDEAAAALRLRLDVTVATEGLLDAVAAAARNPILGEPGGVHVKVDTGMRRYGAEPALAVALARQAATDPALRLVGVSTHFAAADEADDGFTREQAACFDRCLAELAEGGVRPDVAHAANSAAALRSTRYHYDLVRAGIALYGLPPSDDVALAPGMRPVLSLRSRVVRVTDLAPGDTVGYGRTYRAAGGERAALVPIGYGDGYPRSLSGRGRMGIEGRAAPVIGRVSMDQTVLAVPDGIGAEVGTEVVVLGDPGEGAPSAVDLARLLGTIPYEVMTGLAPRIERRYLRSGREVPVSGEDGTEAG
ncbi:MAG: alanine racemase, partial [Chloroflexota bacterium]|nr:alanine racemase [Chloroflexota bacterium]